ncbi:MAG: hypothetical protein ABIA92_01360 [Patescibacteria group bacterium]
MKPLSKEQQELDRTRITISFGLISFFIVVLFYAPNELRTWTIFGVLDVGAKIVFGYALLQFFMFIVCTAAQYKSAGQGNIDGIRISPKSADYHFDSAVDWSFIGILAALIVVFSHLWLLIANWGIDRCGENWTLVSTCNFGFISFFILISFLVMGFYRKSF